MDEQICVALEGVGITSPFPIQALALPIALGGHDIIGQARTGTGKTLAFGIPLLQKLGSDPDRRPSAPAALVVVPTRELAIQVAEDLRVAGVAYGTRVLTVYGGRAYEPQIESLRKGVDIVVGTPGRLLDLVGQRHLDLSGVRSLVLDEADKMLDLGFLPDVERILEFTPAGRQTMLFSATMPGEVVTLARRHLSHPLHVRGEQHDEPDLVPLTVQHVYRAHQMDKIEMLARILQANGRGLTMVFCRTKRSADQVAEALTTRGFAAAAVHGDLGQGQRERAMRAFRNGKIDVLVATDVAARGLDVDDVTHVINYECPEDDKAYLHRTGRTGRAGRDGIAVTFVDWRDMPRWKLINEALEHGPARAAGDLLDLRAPVHRPGHPGRGDRPAAPGQPGTARPGGRGTGRHRRDRPVPVTRAAPVRAARRAGRAQAADPQADPGRGHGAGRRSGQARRGHRRRGQCQRRPGQRAGGRRGRAQPAPAQAPAAQRARPAGRRGQLRPVQQP